MRIDITENTSDIEPAWWRLWRRSARASVFQSPAWLIPWARQFATEGLLLTGYEDGELAALVPLFRCDGRFMLWGAGTTDWLDGLFAPGIDIDVLVPELERLGAPVDLFQLPADSPLLGLAGAPGASVQSAEPCVVLPLEQPLPRNAARNLAYYLRRAARAGVAGPSLLPAEAFEALVELHARRWARDGQPGVLRDPKVLAWHRETVPQLEAAGLLRLYGMTLEDRIVGVLYAFSGKDRAHYYLSGFDPELSALGLGTILVGHAIAQARREGCRSFDFLRGREPYKYHWGATDIPSQALLLDLRERALVES